MAVRRGEKDRVLVDGSAAVTDVERVIDLVLVVPPLLTRARVHGPDIIWRSDVESAIHQDRRRLNRLVPGGLKAPGLFQISDILRRDLRQLAVALAIVFAVVSEPRIGRRIQQLLWIDALRSGHTD